MSTTSNSEANPGKLRDDALAIWTAGVEAVKPSRLLAAKTSVEGTRLRVDQSEVDFSPIRKLIVVGAGKASANLAIEFERQVISKLRQACPTLTVEGWINCPEGSFSAANSLSEIQLYEARPAGLNEPTEKAVLGTSRIIDLVAGCSEEDLVVCLISGGGSALLTAPSPGITLADKQAVARLVAAAGANIDQLNCVRRALSQVKGGGLAAACRAGRMLTVIISDVLGDSLQTIASGPTVAEASVDPQQALSVIQELHLTDDPRLANVVKTLRNRKKAQRPAVTCAVEHVILGNNADAVDAAGSKAVELGYQYVMECARKPEGDVLEVAQHAFGASQQLLQDNRVNCWISGGEPTVELPKAGPGQGGRNQQLALAVLHQLTHASRPDSDVASSAQVDNLAFVSGGTDGEDGPTDAAGALFDGELFRRSLQLGLDMREYLDAANAYPFFEQTGGLIKTGPTGTNVCDLRVAITRG